MVDHVKQGKAAKVKGTLGEKMTSDIVEKFSFADCFKQPGSGSGKNPKYKSDLYIRLKLSEDLKIELKSENKFYKHMAIFPIWKKLKAETLINYIPVMTLKENNSDTLIALKLQDFLGILESCKYKIDRAEKENIIINNQEDTRAKREIKFFANRILQEVKKV